MFALSTLLSAVKKPRTLSSIANFSAHAAPAIEGRIKVTDSIIWINVVPPDGVPRRIAATSGESLLEVIQRHRVPGIHADCGGGDQENSMRAH
jgi:hypothetical protein